MKNQLLMFLLTIMLLMSSSLVMADATKRSGGSDAAAAKAQMLLRQITAERDGFRAEAEKLKGEVEKRDKKITALNHKVANFEKRLGHSSDVIDKYKENSEVLRDRILDARDKMQKLVDKYRELVVALKVVEGERVQLIDVVDEKEQLIKQCSKDNVKLYEANLELIELYKKKSVWDAIAQAEPVTQLKKVQIENIAQEYKIKLDNLSYANVAK